MRNVGDGWMLYLHEKVIDEVEPMRVENKKKEEKRRRKRQ